jgi:BNR repeat-containing family member
MATSEVPFRMDASNQAGWWKPLEEYNGSVYMAYNAWGDAASGGATDTHTIYVAKRAPDGSWTRGCLKDANGICAVYPDDIGHRQPTIAIDGHGYIHVFAAMHQDNWRYWRSGAPGDVTSMIWQGRSMPDQDALVTYPSAGRAANGDVYVIVRTTTSGRLYRWNNATNVWTRIAVFASQSGFSVYPDDVIGDSNGNIHIAWEWASGSAGGLRHRASYLRYSPSTNQFFSAAGDHVTVPATTATSAAVFQPLEGSEQLTGVGSADPGVQSAKLALNPANNRPLAAYRYKTTTGGQWTVRLAEWNGSSWQRSVVYAGLYDTFAAIDISMYGTGTRVYYSKIGTPAGNQVHSAERQSGGPWVETSLLPGVPVERLSVIRRNNIDYLYLASPSTQKLYFGTSTW